MVESINRSPTNPETPKSLELLGAPPISANELLKRTIKEPRELALAKIKIVFYKFSANGVTEFTGVIKRNLRGLGFNHLLFSLAPYKSFGLDTNDILNDWKAIDNPPYERKSRHEAMGKPWFIFDRDRLYFREIIERDRIYGSWKE